MSKFKVGDRVIALEYYPGEFQKIGIIKGNGVIFEIDIDNDCDEYLIVLDERNNSFVTDNIIDRDEIGIIMENQNE